MINSTSGKEPEFGFYDAAPLEPHLLYQGETLVDVPLMLMPKATRWLLVRTKDGSPLEQALNKGQNPSWVKVLDSNQTKIAWDGADGDYVLARLSKRPVLVVSQTCDISNRDFIAVAPIHPASEVTDEQRETAKTGGMFDVFYLPAHDSPALSEGFADLGQLQAVHRSYIKQMSPDQHFRLSEPQVLTLQQRITRYFGRPNSFDARVDKAPRSGIYQCVACFYMSGVVTPYSAVEGSALKICDQCGGYQWIKRSGA